MIKLLFIIVFLWTIDIVFKPRIDKNFLWYNWGMKRKYIKIY